MASKIIEHPELEGAHEDHQVHLLTEGMEITKMKYCPSKNTIFLTFLQSKISVNVNIRELSTSQLKMRTKLWHLAQELTM